MLTSNGIVFYRNNFRIVVLFLIYFQCFDTVGWATGRAPGL